LCQRPLTRLLSHHIPTPPLARSLARNSIGDKFYVDALAAILKETQITNLKCAAAPVSAFLSMPIDTPTLSLSPPHTPRSQSARQHDRRPRRLRARCHPQGDDDHPSRVRCCPIVFAFVHCQRPLTLCHSPPIAAWATTSSAASTTMATAPSPRRVSLSCVMGSRGAP